MIIAVDAGCLGVSDNRLKVGVYYVAVHLLQELSRLDTKNTYILYSFQPIPQEVLKQFNKQWKNVVLPSKGWLYVSLPLEFLKHKPDIFLALSQAMPWYHPYKTIGLIHGLDFLPEFHQERNKKLQKNSEYLIHHANTLITTSQFLKKSLEEKYNAKNSIVAPLGIDKIFFQKTKPYKLDKPYFLFVGTFKPSKNIPTILRAFKQFLIETKKKYLLLCIGSTYWDYPEMNQLVTRLDLQKNIILKDSMPQQELASYYAGAVALVSPSLYEGFGLPFVEAMASGCPIIGSPVGAIPEIVADAGLLYDAKDSNSIANGMIHLSQDKILREKLIKKGGRRAKDFSWVVFAHKVLQVINEV